MNTGVDVSLRECGESGYAVVQHSSPKMKPNVKYLLTITNPEFWPNGRRMKVCDGEPYQVYDSYSYKELYEYWQTIDGINKYCGVGRCPFIAPDGEMGYHPNFHDFVHMAQTLHSYCGLP